MTVKVFGEYASVMSHDMIGLFTVFGKKDSLLSPMGATFR